MTIQQQIDNAREHLQGGREAIDASQPGRESFVDYSYRALMSAAIRSSVSSRSLHQYYKALDEDGYELLDQFNPTVDDIVKTEK